jgi:hypothetical protein
LEIVEPSLCHSPIVFIGRNRNGQWVARERNGLFGGLFVSQQAAVRYALSENHHHPETVITIAALELGIGAMPLTEGASSAPSRRAAA